MRHLRGETPRRSASSIEQPGRGIAPWPGLSRRKGQPSDIVSGGLTSGGSGEV